MESGERCIRILSVDDEPRNLRILGELFDDLGEHRKVATGLGALECMESFVPDVALVDIMLPDIEGYKICEFIRSSHKHRFTKVVLVSGKSALDEKLRGYAVGADDYVTKPFVPEELHAKVSAFLRVRDLEDRLALLNGELEEKVRLRTAQLLQAEQLAWLGTNAAQVLHNLANPIQVIKAQIGLIEKHGATDKYLAVMTRNLERLWETARTILHSTRTAVNVSEETSVDLNEVIQEEIKLLETNAFFRYGVELQMQLDEGRPSLTGRATHFHQVFGNLIRNAVESTYACQDKKLNIETAIRDAEIVVAIRDSGCGIAPENLCQIYDPFFTTKPMIAEKDEPTGTGLGLASVRELLALYGASIEFDSEKGRGTCVTVRFPLGPRW